MAPRKAWRWYNPANMETATSPGWNTLARVMESTLLRPDATRDGISLLCRQAADHDLVAVCVQPCWVAAAVSDLCLTPVKVATVIGFPHGATVTTSKRFEASEVLRLGADELDMVLNLGALKSGEHVLVETEIRSVAEVAHDAGALLKVILETALLTNEQKLLACELAISAGADYVKTSTGFGPAGATVEDVALLRATVRDRAGVKAAGGIRTASDVRAMLAAGADRVGTSSALDILREIGAAPAH